VPWLGHLREPRLSQHSGVDQGLGISNPAANDAFRNPKVRPDDLKPFLGGLSPYGPIGLVNALHTAIGRGSTQNGDRARTVCGAPPE
jgi:hypothetical protein